LTSGGALKHKRLAGSLHASQKHAAGTDDIEVTNRLACVKEDVPIAE
jgi:hypothetical protein